MGNFFDKSKNKMKDKGRKKTKRKNIPVMGNDKPDNKVYR